MHKKSISLWDRWSQSRTQGWPHDMTSHLQALNNFATVVMVGIRIHLIHCLVVTSSLQQREEPGQGDAVPLPPHTRHYMRQHKRKMY